MNIKTLQIFLIGSFFLATSANALLLEISETPDFSGTVIAEADFDNDGIVTITDPLGSWLVNVVTGLSKPAIGDESVDVINLFSINVSGGSGTIYIRLSDADFDKGEAVYMTTFGGTTNGSVDFQSYVDSTNVVFGQGLLLSDSGVVADAFSGSASGELIMTDPYSMSIYAAVSHAGAGQVTSFDYTFEIMPAVLEVEIDIKFCSDPNAFNCEKKGVLPVTIFGTDTFDVADIDVSTLQLCTEEDLSVCTGPPSDYSIADRGDPTSDLGAAQCALLEVEEGIFEEQDYLTIDGFLDLDVAFEAREVQEILESFCDSAKNAVSEPLVIIGSTIGGTDIYTVPIPNLGTDQLKKVNK